MSTIIGLSQHDSAAATQPAALARVERLYGTFTDPDAPPRSYMLFDTSSSMAASAAEEAPEELAPFHQVETEDVSNDREYTIDVTIGTPGVTVRLNVDTGSSDLWVWSTQIDLDADILKDHQLYDASKSTSAKEIKNGRWEVAYSDGSECSGNIYSDILKIGDITVVGQGIQAAQKVSKGHITDKNADGVIGMGWPGWNQAFPKQKLPLENMMEQKLLNKGLFSSLLRTSAEGVGFYAFGTIPAKEAGVKLSDIKYAPVNGNTGNWTFQSTQAVVAGKTIERQGNRAFADTGTSLVYIGDDVVEEIYAKIDGASCVTTKNRKVWYYPQGAAIPDIQIAVGNTLVKVPPQNFSYGLPKEGMMYGGIQSRGSQGRVDIFGVVFLKGVFVVWDQENNQIGVAERKRV